MPHSVLARVKIWTILVALAGSVALWLAISPAFAQGVFLTALWSVAGLWALEGLLRSAVVPPGKPRNGFLIIIWGFLKLTVYGVAVWVLFSRPFPALSHVVGFTLLMVVMVIVGARSRAQEINLSTGRGEDAQAES